MEMHNYNKLLNEMCKFTKKKLVLYSFPKGQTCENASIIVYSDKSGAPKNGQIYNFT